MARSHFTPRRVAFFALLVVMVPLWGIGIYGERQTEVAGVEVVGRIVRVTDANMRFPRVEVTYPAGAVEHEKSFGVTEALLKRATGGTGGIVNPEIRVRVAPAWPDDARLAESEPLPWWGGLIGMSVVIGVLAATMLRRRS